MGWIGEIVSQTRDRRRTEDAKRPRKVIVDPLIIELLNAGKETGEGFDGRLGVELSERAPGVDRRPDPGLSESA